ncbi:hypothetical protein FRC01_005543 [Tulasnella sp. 417]|nr:hypothetical protein FRC01_005543 [Tulasnella sp. 417]
MTLSLDRRINVARRISDAEANLLAMLPDGAGTKGLLPYGGWTDEKRLLYDCIAPRLERVKTNFFGPPLPYPALDWWGLAWILGLWRGQLTVSMIQHERRIANIELILNIVGSHDSFKPEFWAEIVQWQLRTHKQMCAKYLEEFFRKTAKYTRPDDFLNHLGRYAVKTAVQRTLAEQEPSPGDVTWTDVFGIRVLYYDPFLNAAIEATPAPEGRPDKLDFLIEKLCYDEQPRFPPSCHALKFK